MPINVTVTLEMCGIAGRFGFDNSQPLLQTMNDAQAHRGPDGEGYFVEGQIGLAHRSLAIIDKGHGDQPIYNHDKSLVIVYNGEIYNYRELREELETAGFTFKTQTDTEVIVNAYAAWGDAAF